MNVNTQIRKQIKQIKLQRTLKIEIKKRLVRAFSVYYFMHYIMKNKRSRKRF